MPLNHDPEGGNATATCDAGIADKATCLRQCAGERTDDPIKGFPGWLFFGKKGQSNFWAICPECTMVIVSSKIATEDALDENEEEPENPDKVLDSGSR